MRSLLETSQAQQPLHSLFFRPIGIGRLPPPPTPPGMRVRVRHERCVDDCSTLTVLRQRAEPTVPSVVAYRSRRGGQLLGLKRPRQRTLPFGGVPDREARNGPASITRTGGQAERKVEHMQTSVRTVSMNIPKMLGTMRGMRSR